MATSVADSHKRERLKPTRLADTVALQLIDDVVRGEVAAGSTLPGEQTLCDEFGVSRVVIREALKSLELKGLLVIRQGQGTVVAESRHWHPLDAAVLDARIKHDESLTVLAHVVQVRAALESEMAGAAATLRSSRDVDELTALTKAMGDQLDVPAAYLDLDLAFHDRIMLASQNDIGHAVVTGIHTHARASDRYSGGVVSESVQRSHVGHLRILEAIVNGSPEQARDAMRRHIDDSWTEKLDSRRSGR